MKRGGRIRRRRAVSRRGKAWGLRDQSRAASLAARERDRVCQRCRQEPSTEAHHVFPKGKFPDLRLVADNLIGLCGACHRWADGQARGKRWFAETFPERYARLKMLAGVELRLS